MTSINKTLYRIPKQGKIAGVCAGLADYFDFDVTLMRIIWVVVAFASGGGVVLVYILMAVILPVSDQASIKNHAEKEKSNDTSIDEKVIRLGKDLQNNKVIGRIRNYFGISLVVFGVWLLLVQFMPQWFDIRWEYVWPVLLIILGVLIIVRRKDDGK